VRRLLAIVLAVSIAAVWIAMRPRARAERALHGARARSGAAVARGTAPEPAPRRVEASSLALDQYRDSSVYPPTSRPLRPSDRHLIDWNRRHETARPAACDPSAALLFSADRYWLSGDDVLEPFVELGGERAFSVRSARAELIDSVTGARSEPVSLAFGATGRRRSATFAPAELGLEQPARIRLSVEIECNGKREEHAIHVVYSPERALPARFTGEFRDALEGGSLMVHAGIEVAVAGWFVIDANLHDAHGRPVAWTRFKGELAAGRGEVPLSFFGKVLLDSGGEPPFRMAELRGARYAEGRDPDLEPMPPYAGTHGVDCDLGALSDAEWDAPEKRAKLEMLEREARDPGAPRIRAAR
jgi:hypothetical protein